MAPSNSPPLSPTQESKPKVRTWRPLNASPPPFPCLQKPQMPTMDPNMAAMFNLMGGSMPGSFATVPLNKHMKVIHSLREAEQSAAHISQRFAVARGYILSLENVPAALISELQAEL
eukprot:TRINITY_DN16107_c0_g1_i1.p1 TRINITY_DN16107_c0_g1~~TRINITY_DN16107_c0_g1_i1.p1  ORF type:complete len:117 (+),score=9.90 TRINITY_DN16107_c0_g1_i1:473-823(+)